ncbi:MAG: lasso peptide biosynthesis B2 protein [Proteobacteria bacterium]|nr:lasso peptide biosynthesis B2 protein [Pseudomonadota bacterium]
MTSYGVTHCCLAKSRPLPPLGVFFLQSHIYLCRAQRHWVILDVNRDKYLCVDRTQFESLGPWIDGWEGTPARRPAPTTSPSPAAVLLAKSLVNLKMLSEQPQGAKEARATTYAHPTRSVDLDESVSTARSRCIYGTSFFLGCMIASRQLREQRFESIVASVQARKRAARDSDRPFDLERAQILLAVFSSLRLFYPRPYLCLFDSLALVHFLARFDLYPDWVFGVRADPFEAHCWVQAGGVALNETVERVSALTPIMAI